MRIFFANPHSPWHRGANENTNGLLRQNFPKGTTLALWDQEDLNTVAASQNDRPRKTLDYDTPTERFYAAACPTGRCKRGVTPVVFAPKLETALWPRTDRANAPDNPARLLLRRMEILGRVDWRTWRARFRRNGEVLGP
jgi:hypothetical protein